MAKGWKTIFTNSISDKNTKENKVKKDKNFDNLMRKTKAKVTTYDLKKEGEELFNQRLEKEESLLSAAADGKLQSQTLKNQAAAIQKNRDKKNKKGNNK